MESVAIAQREGTFPWCEDSGTPMVDGGVEPPVGDPPTGTDAGPDTDGGTDACSAASDSTTFFDFLGINGPIFINICRENEVKLIWSNRFNTQRPLHRI